MEKKELERRMVFAREEAIKAWPKEKTIDAELVEEFARILVVHMYKPHLGCVSTGELLAEIMARSNLDYRPIGDV